MECVEYSVFIPVNRFQHRTMVPAMKFLVNIIPYVIAAMTFWDFSIHVIDKRDRKYMLAERWEDMWLTKLKRSKNFISYYYPHFWGKKPITNEKAWRRYDHFWLVYWGSATALIVIYILFR